MKTPIAPLGELCKMDRQGLQPDDPAALHLPFVGVENIDAGTGILNYDTNSRVGSQRSTTFRFDERHVLYAKLRPYLNKVTTPGFAGRCSTELVPLLPRSGVDRDFVAHLLRRKQTVEYVMASVTGSRMPRTDMKALMTMRVPLPPLDEQRRIVGILNRAARIERLRAQSEEQLREFIPALFIRMFGDPVENPMGWQIRSLSKLVEEFRYGTSRKCSTEHHEGNVPVLRIPNVLGGTVNWNDMKFTSLSGKEERTLKLKTGDILFVRTNGNPDYIGRCAVYADSRRAAYASYLIRARLKMTGSLVPEYVSTALALPSIRQIILRLARTTAGNYNININSLGRLPLSVPPLVHQEKFLSICRKAAHIGDFIEIADQTSSRLTASLMSRLLADDV